MANGAAHQSNLERCEAEMGRKVRDGWYACGMAFRRKRREKTKADPRHSHGRGDAAETGAFVSTFTFRLPFRMGVSDNLEQEIAWPSDYQNAKDGQRFGAPPFVRLRLFNAAIPDRKFSPANAPAAVRRFYGTDYELGPPDDGDPYLYEQWVSLETPAVLLVGEDPNDGAYAFHRGLSALDVYLRAFALARNQHGSSDQLTGAPAHSDRGGAESRRQVDS
jgi:hypothetical protein